VPGEAVPAHPALHSCVVIEPAATAGDMQHSIAATRWRWIVRREEHRLTGCFTHVFRDWGWRWGGGLNRAWRLFTGAWRRVWWGIRCWGMGFHEVIFHQVNECNRDVTPIIRLS
jgi:hypothetical protein